MDENMYLPKHIAIIMDGNRRWARERNLKVSDGHKRGAEALEVVARYCNDIGIKHLTVYAFSTENWKRAEDEVGALMKILKYYLPDPDLLIRTSGEIRTSNFLPWQLVYSEFYFVEKYWPDFNEKDVDEAIKVYQKRNRKFGGK